MIRGPENLNPAPSKTAKELAPENSSSKPGPPAGNYVGTATIPAQGNTVNGATTFGVVGIRTAINTIGAFYSSSLTTDRGRISGGTPKAQAFILLHELGHVLGVLADDADKQGDIDANDKKLEEQCKKAVSGF